MEFVHSNLVWKLVDLLTDVRHIVVNGSLRKRKVCMGKWRLSKQGRWQSVTPKKKKIVYEENFSPMAMLKSIHILLPIVACLSYEI